MPQNIERLLIHYSKSVKQAMRQMSDVGKKELYVIADDRTLFGSLSDGDVRKWILQEGSLDALVEKVCNRNPKTVQADYNLEDVKQTMLTYKIESLPMVDDRRFVSKILYWDDVFAGNMAKYHDPLNVPVVIMAGGQGSRLDPFTKILPKPLIPIGEKPIIELILERFVTYGAKEFCISIFHKARMIKSYFEEANYPFKIQFLEEIKPLGTVGALQMLQGKMKSDFIVTNCDVIIECDYAELVRFHQEHQYDLTLVVSARHYTIPYGICELSNGGRLKTIKEKPEYDFLVNTGMYVMSPRILDLIPREQSFNIIELIDAAKSKDLTVGAFPISEKAWIDVGQWEQYYKSVQDLQKKLESA